jgi:hypothetical protein
MCINCFTASLSSSLQDSILQVREGTSRHLRPILRDEAYRIAGEAVRNALTLIGIIRLRESDKFTRGVLL